MRALPLAALALLVPACTGGDDDDPAAAARRFCVDETNRYRALHERAPVAWSAELEAYANAGAEYDHHANPHDHFRDTGGGGIAFAENQCPRWNLPAEDGDLVELVARCIAAFYGEGPGGGHYEIMLGNYGTLGCGIYQEGRQVTIIQNYGR
jgi:hypothetical protein